MKMAPLEGVGAELHAELRRRNLLRKGDRVVQSVRLEGIYPHRHRFLTIIEAKGQGQEKSAEIHYCILGIDKYPRGKTKKINKGQI